MTESHSPDAERPASIEARRVSQPTAHAQAAKVLTTGLSVSMVLGIVAYLAKSNAAAEQAKADAELLAQISALQQTTTTAPWSGATVPVIVGDSTTVPPLDTLVPGQTPVTAQPAGGSSGGGTGAGSSGGGTGSGTTSPPTATTVVANPPATTTPPPPPPPPPPTTSTTTAVSG